MNSHHVRHPTREVGIGWLVLPLAGAMVALALLAAWPELFGQPLPQDAGALSAAPAAPYTSSDPSLPPASSVFKDGASYETAQHVDTF
jgi:hypothetical protein